MSTKNLSSLFNPQPALDSKGTRTSTSSLLKRTFDQKLNKHGKHTGAHLDDMGDIYDHTKEVFGEHAQYEEQDE